MPLDEYRRKRDFAVTPEPAGKAKAARGAAAKKRKKKPKGLSFVIQKHAATRLHYDFRLEMEGVLRSWAVPKGPSLDPAEKRLAVHVEDHPLDYGDFEGVIPKGQYGGGTVLLWDRGTWEPLEGDPVEAYRKGRLKFRLDGEKLQGGWMLVRTGGRAGSEYGKENWLLIKERDEAARPGSGDAVVRERPESVTTGQTLEEIAADPQRVWQSNREEEGKDTVKARLRAAAARREEKAAAKKAKPAKRARPTTRAAAAEKPSPSLPDLSSIPGVKKGPLPGEIEPQLATLVDEPPRGEGWLHEIKYDGYRLLGEVAKGKARLLTRHAKDWTDSFPPVARAAAELPVRQALLDGEVVVLQPDGRTSFQALQNAIKDRRGELVFFAFDLLHLDGWDLRGAPLVERKRVLEELLGAAEDGGALRFSGHVEGRGEEFYRSACGHKLEGIVAKRADRPYRSGRGRDWLKVKCLSRQEFVIVGYTDPEGSRTGFGALLLAVREPARQEDGGLVFAGKAGTGFDEKTLRELHKRLRKLERKTPAFANPPRGAEARRSHWVEPKLVAEVAFTEWTDEGLLRHPAFLGLREDKKPEEIVRERPVDQKAVDQKAAEPPAERSRATAPSPSGKPKKGKVEIAGVALSNPDKVLYPESGTTKRDLALFYAGIGDWLLPHLKGRPLTMLRCPEGRTKECFYQKHVNDQFPDSIERVYVDGPKEQPYGAVRTLHGVVWLVQLGVLELHVWGAHSDQFEKPDMMVFDLDPDEGLPWERVAEAALRMRLRLEELGLRSFLKTTGGKGLHVVVPVARRTGWDDFKAFSKAVAESIVAEEPKRYTAMIPKAHRKGKVLLDYLRNGRGATAVVAYSTRARPGATVSTPLFWEELVDPELRGSSFTVATVPARLDKLKSDPWEEFFSVRQSITADMRKAVGLRSPS